MHSLCPYFGSKKYILPGKFYVENVFSIQDDKKYYGFNVSTVVLINNLQVLYSADLFCGS